MKLLFTNAFLIVHVEFRSDAGFRILIYIPVTRKVKGYSRFVGKYVTNICKRFSMNAVISETIEAPILGLGMQILEIPAQRKFVSSVFHAHYNTHKAPKTLPHACLNKILTALQCSHQ